MDTSFVARESVGCFNGNRPRDYRTVVKPTPMDKILFRSQGCTRIRLTMIGSPT
jgi:hypothetical protein